MRSNVYGLFFNIAEEKAMKLLICGDTVPTENSAEHEDLFTQFIKLILWNLRFFLRLQRLKN